MVGRGRFLHRHFFNTPNCSLFIPFSVLTFLSLLLLSCGSLSPLSGSSEAIPQPFSSPKAIVPQWQPFAADLTPGLDYFAGSVQNPKLKLWALRVDLTAPSLRFVVSEKEPVNGLIRDAMIPSTKITSFARGHNCLVGINTNPFSPVTGQEGEERTIIGITISDGTLVAPPHPAYDALVFYRDGRTALVKQAALGDLSAIQNAVGGFSIVLQGGDLPDRLKMGQKEPRHPRSAAGLSADGRTLYLLVIDGRRLGSIGATESEIALILKQLGASDGLNFDGGGSTALALRYPDGKIRAVNTPIHGAIPGRERGVATCLGIALR
jgi:hypothetical protein